MINIPVLIIGAGPAGLSTALHLIQHGNDWSEKMILIDKAAHPRHKLCGGAITPIGIKFLKGLALPDPLPIPHAKVRDARMVYKTRTVHVRGNPELLIFHRAEFDDFLAQTAKKRGVRIQENERVLKIDRKEDHVTVTTDREIYQAKVVIGADGSKGLSRGVLNKSKKRIRVARLLETIHPAKPEANQFTDEYALFDFTPTVGELQGYVWDFPAMVNGLPHHNRGIYDARVSQKRQRAKLPAVLNEELHKFGVNAEDVIIEGHPIHWFSPRNTIAGDHLMLVGDAAGAEPLFGEGIAPALGYGKIAAATVHQAFETGKYSFKNYKRKLIFSDLGAYLLIRWYVGWWSYRLSKNTWFMHIMWTIGRFLALIFKRG